MWKRRENSNVVFEKPAGRQRADWVVGRRAMPVGAEYAHWAALTIVIGKRDLPWAKACCLVREPDAGDPPVRFDERRLETEPWRG
jgi:hypothetical protein